MKSAILAWYAYAESGAAAEPEGIGTRLGSSDLDNPSRVKELLSDVRALNAEMTPHRWEHLWTRYGLEGLIDLSRQCDWPESSDDAEVAEALVSESVHGGYDPVAGLLDVVRSKQAKRAASRDASNN